MVAGRLLRGPFYSRAVSVRCWEMELGTEWRKLGECMQDGKVTALGGWQGTSCKRFGRRS